VPGVLKRYNATKLTDRIRAVFLFEDGHWGISCSG
jgi:hypothetical protein